MGFAAGRSQSINTSCVHDYFFTKTPALVVEMCQGRLATTKIATSTQLSSTNLGAAKVYIPSSV